MNKKDALKAARACVGRVEKSTYGPHYFFRLRDPRDSQPVWVNMVNQYNPQCRQMTMESRREILEDIFVWYYDGS